MARSKSSTLDRRSFLFQGGLAAGVALAGPLPSFGTARAVPSNGGGPFTLGVASGDPLSDAVVIWTKLAPEPQYPDGGMSSRPAVVGWQVARDDRFRHVVREGRALALPQNAHAVHVDVKGLAPDETYWYRFHYGFEQSAVGRTRTAPARVSHVESLRFAFASCQDYQDGYYTPYRHMVEEDLAFVVFLGDYIYEGGPSGGAVRPHSGSGEPVTLDEYRVRYALYRSDPDLQSAHAAFPWIATLDDHEVDNDWSGDNPQDPLQQPTEQFLARRAAAFQAFWEYMPMRRRQRPSGPDMRLYRGFDFGDLASFSVLDTRQYRSLTEPCGFGTGPLDAPVGDRTCEEVVFDPSRTALGDGQESWLFRRLARSEATWNVLAQQIPITRLDVGEPAGPPEFKLDKWDAYPVARQRLFDFLAENRPRNPIAITGDLHDNWVALLKQSFDDPGSRTVGTEFIGSSISSDGDGEECSEEGELVLGNGRNPHVLFHNNRRGYAVCELSHEAWRTDFRVVPFVEADGAGVMTRASFVVEDGRPEPVQDGGLPVCEDPFAP
jgi:alkaline phosphatase D